MPPSLSGKSEKAVTFLCLLPAERLWHLNLVLRGTQGGLWNAASGPACSVPPMPMVGVVTVVARAGLAMVGGTWECNIDLGP